MIECRNIELKTVILFAIIELANPFEFDEGGCPMKKRFLYLLLPIITLILEVLPYGAVCVFASSPTERVKKTFSYFDLTPFGFANFAPFLTAIITCLVFVLLLIFCINGNVRIAIKARNILYVAIVMSLAPLVFGIAYFSLVATLITLSLLGELLFLQFTIKNPTKNNPI